MQKSKPLLLKNPQRVENRPLGTWCKSIRQFWKMTENREKHSYAPFAVWNSSARNERKKWKLCTSSIVSIDTVSTNRTICLGKGWCVNPQFGDCSPSDFQLEKLNTRFYFKFYFYKYSAVDHDLVQLLHLLFTKREDAHNEHKRMRCFWDFRCISFSMWET